MILTSFDRSKFYGNKADFGEKTANLGLGLLRIGFGKTVRIENISGNPDAFVFTEKTYSTFSKVAAVALFIFALPVTLIFAGVGSLCLALSKSRIDVLNIYNNRCQKPEQPLSNQKIKAPSFTPEEIQAAITIQKHIRGHLSRKAHLPNGLYAKYSAQCKMVKSGTKMPEAQTGNTRVYLPAEMPDVVLKLSGRKKAKTRFHQMQHVRSLLRSEKSSHLVIPRANLCEDFLVEQRLPITVDKFYNMALYLSEPNLFDEAVRELTRVFSKVYLSDLLQRGRLPIGDIPGVKDHVRYDNLPLYVEEENGKKVGKIGLIDLEHMRDSPAPEGLETLARIFPLHVDLILNEAAKLQMEVDKDAVLAAAERGKKFLRVGYSDHLEWLKKKNISDASFKPFKLSKARKNELIHSIKEDLLKQNSGINELYVKMEYGGDPPKNFFGKNPEKSAGVLAKGILPIALKKITSALEKHGNKHSGKKLSDTELVNLRSPLIEWDKIYNGIFLFMIAYKKKDTDFSKVEFDTLRRVAIQSAFVLLEELAKGGEICSFDRGYCTSGTECWIRY